MTKEKLPEQKEPAHSINLYITGEPIPVNIGKTTVYLRQPSFLERDQADFQESLFARQVEVDNEEIGFLSESDAPQSEIDRIKRVISEREKLFKKEEDETRKRLMNERVNLMYKVIENRNAAESIIETYSTRVKMRWYARNLVVDEKLTPLEYDKMYPFVQDAIMKAVEGMMEDIDTIPLELA